MFWVQLVTSKHLLSHKKYTSSHCLLWDFFCYFRKIVRKPSTNSSLSMSSSPSTATKQPKSLMTIIKGGHKSSVFSTSSPATKSKTIKNDDVCDLTKEEYEQLHASLPWFKMNYIWLYSIIIFSLNTNKIDDELWVYLSLLLFSIFIKIIFYK